MLFVGKIPHKKLVINNWQFVQVNNIDTRTK